MAGRTLTWGELPTVDLPDPVAVLAASGGDALVAARQHALQGSELVLSTPSRVDAQLCDELADAGFTVATLDDGAVTVVSKGRERAPEPGRLWLLTSGSTGRPKRIGHTLESLTTVRTRQEPRTWLCPYAPGSYAWWQVITLSLTQPGQDLVVIDPNDLDRWPHIASEHGVTAATGTPTFWRQAIHRDAQALARVPLKQVTLGGEPVDQAILDQLRHIFPDARISWIYASSEVGASIVVHDGRAGFPQEWLDRSLPGRPTISVDGDELVIESPYHGLGLGGAVRTGDRVEIVDGRVLIVGRLNSDEINVGGSKISASLVRRVLTEHPNVVWARVASRKAPIVGRVVVADVVLRQPADRAEVDEASLVQWCSERLPDYGVPRRIRFLDDVPVKETLKSDV